MNDRRIVDVEFGNSTNNGALRRQIGFEACGIAAVGARGACGWVLGNRSFREITKGEGKSSGGQHLDADVGGEEEARS